METTLYEDSPCVRLFRDLGYNASLPEPIGKNNKTEPGLACVISHPTERDDRGVTSIVAKVYRDKLVLIGRGKASKKKGVPNKDVIIKAADIQLLGDDPNTTPGVRKCLILDRDSQLQYSISDIKR